MENQSPEPLQIAAEHKQRLGTFLKERRLAKRKSQEALARGVDCDPKTISNIENAKSAVRADLLDRILNALEIARDEIGEFCESPTLVGTKHFRVRTYILRGLLQGRIDASTQDIRVGLTEFDDPDYRREQLTADDLSSVLDSLAKDGFLVRGDDGRLTYKVQQAVRDWFMLADYADHVKKVTYLFFPFEAEVAMASRIVYARDASSSPDSFYLAIEAAHLAISGGDPFITPLTVGYYQALIRMHRWCLAAMDESKRDAFHEELSGRTLRLWQKSCSAKLEAWRYGGDAITECGKAIDAAANNFRRGVQEMHERLELRPAALDYSPLGWKGSAMPYDP